MKKLFRFFVALVIASVPVIANAESLPDAKNGVITLTKDITLTETYEVEEGKEITLDLAGYSLSAPKIDVYGNLTIKDSVGKGTMNCTNTNWRNAFIYSSGTVTVESGTINNKYGFGIMPNNGKVVVNGGTVSAKYNALAGNNQAGLMYFEVNGGTLTTAEGPAIYMPGPVSLDVTAGTINGGISLRMGTVNISGGIINSITSGIDTPSKYYNNSGNAFFPDAIFVLGGTYTASQEGYTNDLVLNITGGEINCNNSEGSAVAIYDLGKVAQNMTINISGKVELNTKSTTRSAYQVLSLSDIGVSDSNYGNKEYVGKVSTTITGGTYSTDVSSEYIAEGYEATKTNNTYVVSKIVPATEVPTISTTETPKEVTVGVSDTDTVNNVLIASLEKNTDLTITSSTKINLTIDNIEATEEETTKAKEALAKVAENAVISDFFDITINVIDNGTKIGELTELTDKIKLVVALPETLQEAPEGYTRTYYIIRNHDGVIEVLDTTLSSDGKSISFSSDKFSTYALAYTDTEKSESTPDENPKTGDNIVFYVIAGLVSACGIAYIIKSKKFN
jgi:hypothetical protein